MEYLAILSVIVGIAAAAITIYKFIETRFSSTGLTPRPYRPFVIFGIGALVMLLLALFIARTLPSKFSNPLSVSTPSTGNTPTSPPAQIQTASPTIQLTPTPAISPTPPPCSNPPCTLYKEDGSDNWAGWSYPDGWRIVGNGLLLGTETSTMPAAVSPYSIPAGIINFAVEAVIAVPQGVDQSSGAGFGITACGSSTPNGWQGYTGGIVTGFLHLNGNIDEMAAVNRPDGQIGTGTFNPGGDSHTYRLKIRGNNLTLKIGGAPVIDGAKDQEYLPCGPQVGIWDSAAKIIQIQSFAVYEL